MTIIDQIKTEILIEKNHAYADFEQYKVDFLGQEWETVIDSLPQDDFRYGMERCIEIIDKYINEYSKKYIYKQLSNKEWIDFIVNQFDVSRTSAKEMLHLMMSVKKEDNLKKQFSGRK